MAWNTLNGRAPRIIAHRGASGERPEHTLDGYALAVAQGADVIEPDLVLSRDGVLFARHDVGLARSTDIATRVDLAGLAREIDSVRDWWTHDVDAAVIECLRAVQPFPGRSRVFDSREPPPRFASVLELAAHASVGRKRPVVVYPELKQPQRFLAFGLDPVERIATVLETYGMVGNAAPVWLQCFDHIALQRARERCGNRCFALVETFTENAKARLAQLQTLALWADGIAPNKHLLWSASGADSGFVAAAHAVGLEVHAWTFREDTSPAPFSSTRIELETALALGVDAIFCDFPAVALAVRTAYADARGYVSCVLAE